MELSFPPRSREGPLDDPAAQGIDPDGLRAAVDHARLAATPPDAVAYDYSSADPWAGDPPEYAGALGPFPDRRGDQNGIVLRNGSVVAEWGDTTRVDHCFSVAKSFLSIIAGVAYDRGLIESVTDPVGEYVDDGGFESPHNAAITWEQFLQGTSEWEGTLFGKPDAVDRNRPVGKETDDDAKRGVRELREPGTYWEYNDVRINRLALSLTRLWAKPLPRILAHEVMDPIGATRSWEWHGYYNSDVEVDGRVMRSVSGGGHWGGGLWIATRDLARVGQLLLNGGTWGDRRLLSTEWIERARTPCAIEDGYGYLFWLNTDRDLWGTAPPTAYAARGHGGNVLWIDPEDDVVAAVRWLHAGSDDPDAGRSGFFRRLVSAID